MTLSIHSRRYLAPLYTGVTTLTNGEMELTLPYANATELVRDILKWGPDVEVIAPSTLREQVGDTARATADRYL